MFEYAQKTVVYPWAEQLALFGGAAVAFVILFALLVAVANKAR